MILILSAFKRNPAARAHWGGNGGERVQTIRTTKKGQQPVRFCKRSRDFNWGIWQLFNSEPFGTGFKKSAAYQAFGREDRIEENITKRSRSIGSSKFNDAT
jgi:hypothetical protein